MNNAEFIVYQRPGVLVLSGDGTRALIKRMSPEELRQAKQKAEKDPPLYVKAIP